MPGPLASRLNASGAPSNDHVQRRIWIVFGPAGSGKSLVSQRLADALAGRYIEGDDYHSKENVSKMRAKIPLNDNDRWAWLERLASACCDTASEQHDVLLSCSALQRNYRTTLRAAISSKDPSAVSRFIYLRVPSEVAAQRAAQRTGHYMPAAMVASQYDTLEEPDAGLEPDDVIWIDATASAEVTVARALREVRLRSS